MKIRVNPALDNSVDARDEVFITNDEPYVNRAIYAKPGIFKDGEISEKDLSALEEVEQKEAETQAKEAAKKPAKKEE